MPPQDVRLQVTGKTSLQIAWSPPLKTNGKILGYKVYYTTRKGYPISARQVKRSANQKIHLQDLLANATYIVSVSAYNAAGDGPISDDVSVLITPGACGAGCVHNDDFGMDLDDSYLVYLTMIADHANQYDYGQEDDDNC
ncbi:unnamed protein product [Dibothriocephalus latus]|uniref:Fibronectin type-III domain-containing protein n=1 Tax=Dibothriocephalus latus TaxID=60516 RepID=A0A3P6T3I2_DIBLA|nr:unnamed protein product [Dibothriocephalus latus]